MQDVCGYKIEKKLGKGAFAEVFLSIEGSAIKQLNLDKINLENIYGEFDILRQTNHLNVISAEQIFFWDHQICLVMSAGYMTLERYIKENFFSLEDSHKEFIEESLIYGLDYLHKNFILHLDLHAENIVMYKQDTNFIPKIIDFGLSKRGLNYLEESFVERFCPPEVLVNLLQGQEQNLIGQEFDNWYLGIDIYLIWNGYYPFLGGDYIDTLSQIRRKIGLTPHQEEIYQAWLEWNPESQPRMFSNNLNIKLNDLLVADPKKRKLNPKKRKLNPKKPNLAPTNSEFIPLTIDEKIFDRLFQLNQYFGYSIQIYFEALEILSQIIQKFGPDREILKAAIAYNLAANLMANYVDKEEICLILGGCDEEELDNLQLEIIKVSDKGVFRPTLTMLNPELSEEQALKFYKSL